MSLDTGNRMVRDCLGSSRFIAQERLIGRIDRALAFWAQRFIKYGRHKSSCPEGPSHQTGICNCGFREAKQDAELLCKVGP